MTNDQQRLLELKNAAGSYQKLAEQFGMKHGTTIWSFVVHGRIPANKQDRLAMGIYEESYGKTRNDALNLKAQAKGWDHISQYLTDVLKGKADVPPRT